MILTLNGQKFVLQDVSDLRAHLASVPQDQLYEVDLGEQDDPEDDGTFFGLLMLTHADRALLLYFRYDGDAALTSRDTAYSGPPDALLGFQLSNGQGDEYPACWTVPLDDALRALEYALVHRGPAPWITWHDDAVLSRWEEWRTIL